MTPDAAPAPARVLVAGVGNIFDSDDGFGCAVAARLVAPGEPALPAGVRVVDYGIRGVHLAYDLLEGVDALVLVDALPPGSGVAGEVRVLQVSADDVAGGTVDAHGMHPEAVLAALGPLGGTLPPTYVVGCPAQHAGEGIGLTPAVAAAVEPAAESVHLLLARLPVPGPGPDVPTGAAAGRTGRP